MMTATSRPFGECSPAADEDRAFIGEESTKHSERLTAVDFAIRINMLRSERSMEK